MILLDTNLLTRLTRTDHPHGLVARRAVHALLRRGERVVIVPQNLYEFWAVATRRPGPPPGLKSPHDELAPLPLRRSSPSICCRAGASIAVAQTPCGTNLPVKGFSLCALRRGLDLLTCSCERLGRPQSGVGG